MATSLMLPANWRSYWLVEEEGRGPVERGGGGVRGAVGVAVAGRGGAAGADGERLRGTEDAVGRRASRTPEELAVHVEEYVAVGLIHHGDEMVPVAVGLEGRGGPVGCTASVTHKEPEIGRASCRER